MWRRFGASKAAVYCGRDSHADVTVFDPKTIKACAPEWADDYPAATKRLIQRSEGVHYTIVNGKVIYDDGKLSGEMAGNVLRSAAHAGQ